jgi:hypothetical protein
MTEKRMILIGVPTQWVTSFRVFGFHAWRIIARGEESTDIEASILDQPIRHESVHVVIYGDRTGYSSWGSAMILKQSLFGLMLGGYFLFNATNCPQWEPWLIQWGYERLPFRWNDMNIWRKTSTHYKHTISA